jgi:AraC family transcriptional regulator of adaptative response / DNA-3-methyladenine glycosylase II
MARGSDVLSAGKEPVELDRSACYGALRTRDARFDGRFYTAVLTTGIYCRPVCPARTPKIDNCLFLPSAAAAHRLGFRPCLRCRPELAPSAAGRRGAANTVSRALQLIAEGALDDANVDLLAERLGIGGRHLRRLFDRFVGASPISVAQTHRILFAKKLIGETPLSMGEIALAAGFGSVRRFNTAMRRTYGRSPRKLRGSRSHDSLAEASITLRLPFTPPYDWSAAIAFLMARAIPGVELVDSGRYRRTIALGGVVGSVEVRPARGESSLVATIRIGRVTALGTIVARLRRLFDLDADIVAIDEHLSLDPSMAARVARRPGVRVPGTWDAFELAVRAVLGQQISVAAATTLAGRLASRHGEPLDFGGPDAPRLLFPTPGALAAADLKAIGLTGARAGALRALAAAVAADPNLLRSGQTLDDTVRALGLLPGVGTWTAHYIAMRALGEPDAFPASDLGLLRAMETSGVRPTAVQLARRAEAWRPWRSYAAMRLWVQGGVSDAAPERGAFNRSWTQPPCRSEGRG